MLLALWNESKRLSNADPGLNCGEVKPSPESELKGDESDELLSDVVDELCVSPVMFGYCLLICRGK